MRYALCSILLTSFAVAEPHATRDIAKQAFASTVLLVMEDANGQPCSLGSGFMVRDGEIASNLHVVQGAARGYVKLVGENKKYDIQGFTAVDQERDLVLLKINVTVTKPLTVGDSDTAQVGDPVYAVGNPQGLEGTFSQGIVSSVRQIGTDTLLQITAPISPGSSGGPVLNSAGEVIGVSVATFKGGQNLNFAIPSRYLKDLMARPRDLKPLATASKEVKPQRSILADLGGKSTEGVTGAQMAWQLPNNQFSGSYSFSLRNQLRESVQNVYCLVIFTDNTGTPVDVDIVQYRGVIPAGLAKRVNGDVDGSVGVVTQWRTSAAQFRILDFQMAE
jgi:S1-C subfamily serine protease